MQVDESEPYGGGGGCCQDDFLDDLTSFIPDADSYNLDDLDEILRATESQLDASIDFDTFAAPLPNDAANLNNFMTHNGFNFNLSAFPSPATTNESSHCTPTYQSERTSSISDGASSDIDNFNPDDFINLVEQRQMTEDEDVTMNVPERHTPSPTSSCSSSTSGVQSDASSSSQQMETDELLQVQTQTATVANDDGNFVNLPATATPLPIALPLLHVQPVNVLLPISTVTPQENIPKPVPKLAPKITKITKTEPPATTTTTTQSSSSNSKTHLPTNVKPKTIYLSSNDFKALMQRMQNNGKNNAVGASSVTAGAANAVQLPKIIMKTTNGKLIANNKIAQNGVRNNAANATMPINVKQQQPTPQQQQPSKFLSNSSQAQRTTSSSSNAPDINFYKGIMDEKMFKKQQRMIKNRESASLSRKKKKEYVVSLESRINDLEKENYNLKGQNSFLRSQLAAFAQSCQCKNDNVNEFVLNTLSMNEKGGVGQSPHIKIATKTALGKNFKQRMTAANMKKNVAVLFAMAFMVTLNVGNFQNYLNKQTYMDAAAGAGAIENLEDAAALSTGRRLLWVETESEFKQKQNRSKHENDLLDVPPLHFLRPPTAASSNGSAEKTAQMLERTKAENSKCDVLYSNQTENMRLASSLHKWIGGNDYLNLSSHDNELNKHVRFKLTPEYFELKSIAAKQATQQSTETVKQRRKLLLEEETPHYESKKRKLSNQQAHFGNSLELFKPQISDEYLRLFKGIKRQDDTFYVLSFNMDHLLLPASAYNKSSRPKMSLMLPAGDPAMNGDIVLMQIDCEVVNTTELALKSDMIPAKLRPQKYATATKPNDMANNETFDAKPIKIKVEDDDDVVVGKTNTAATTATNATINNLQVKQEPRVRTYFMMGPKSQAAMEASNKEPTLVKLTPSKNVIAGSGILNIKNSTFFSKMQETVSADFKQTKK